MTATVTPTASEKARSLMQSAYENRYTWDHNFPGYTAEVTFTTGSRVHKGRVRVNADLTAEVLDITDEDARQAISQQMQEIAIHRVRRSFAETHGKNTFSLGKPMIRVQWKLLWEASQRAIATKYEITKSAWYTATSTA